ncbi:hypothetical protein O181_073751 [Austropuccinia psidii MF-1]|uniref:Acyltransferase MbtK/IucB-like conserved domain-containing protein n=1 Tax=Austropuccinia psidii MF-1 TaxID=1389203 RepID=A0A9Q3FBQ9_9BASI|nr:hypothetical protein [Austropuccinia psidii MF-1]
MAVLVPRLRPPTFSNPPELVTRLSLGQEELNPSYEGPGPLEVVVSIKEDKHNLEKRGASELACAVWYALWDVVGASDYKEYAEISVTLVMTTQSLMKDIWDELGVEVSGNVAKITRAWWYQRHPIFGYPNLSDSTLQMWSAKQRPFSAGPLSTTCRLPQDQYPAPPETLYERYIDHLDSYFCLSIFGKLAQDIELLHSWLNDPRVDEFWADSGTKEFHVQWLKDRYEDHHVLPILGSYRGTQHGDKTAIEPFAYYEIYWAADDKVAKYYDVEKYDRGIHMLVGSSQHRGPHRVRSWLPSLAHYIFSEEPQTRRIISEPNVRNNKMITYLECFGFERKKDVDMGHKHAAIMVLERDKRRLKNIQACRRRALHVEHSTTDSEEATQQHANLLQLSGPLSRCRVRSQKFEQFPLQSSLYSLQSRRR